MDKKENPHDPRTLDYDYFEVERAIEERDWERFDNLIDSLRTSAHHPLKAARPIGPGHGVDYWEELAYTSYHQNLYENIMKKIDKFYEKKRKR